MEDLAIDKIKNLKNTRHFVIELSVIIEEIISQVLGELLNIKWEESKSLGYKSEGLSFNHKVNLIQDINGIRTEFKKKLIVFMRIRNKFAHVKSVNSFEYLFLENSCEDILKSMNNWYKSKYLNSSEIKYRELFFQLFTDIQITFTLEIMIESQIAKDVQESLDNHKNKLLNLLDILIAENENSELGNEIYLKALKKLNRQLKVVK